MSEQELESHVGINMTEMVSLGDPISKPGPLSSTPVPLSKDHRRETGLTLTRAVDHTHCGGGSWAHSVVAVLESRYKVLTDEIALFSEQELLDCSYSDDRNSCKGGYMTAGFQYIKDGCSKPSAHSVKKIHSLKSHASTKTITASRGLPAQTQ